MKCSASYISYKNSKANNKYLISYDPKKPTKHIIYQEKSNSYCYTMSASLPMYGFERLDASKFNLDKYDGDSLRS